MRLKLIKPPSVEPVSLDEVKQASRISHEEEDGIIGTWITTARKIAEGYQRRSFLHQIWELSFDAFPDLPILIPRAPLVQMISVSYFDAENVETVPYYKAFLDDDETPDAETNSDFLVDTSGDPGRLSFAYGKSWPSAVLRPVDAVRIRYAAGYGEDADSVPEQVKDAIMLYCAWRDDNRTAEAGALPRQFYDLLAPDRLFLGL